MALRELALRRMADRVEAASRAALGGDGEVRGWLARDRVLVAIGPDPQAEQVIRAGKRIADALDAEWTVVYVETPALRRLSERERDRRIALLRLGESLGAETVTLDGPSAVEALLEYATTRRATRVVVGAPKRRGWPRGSAVDCHRAGAPGQGFDVITMAAGEPEASRDERSRAARADEARAAAPLATLLRWRWPSRPPAPLLA